MPKPRRRQLLASVVALAVLSTVVPAGTSDAATTIYYNGAGSSPRISMIGDSTLAAVRSTNQFEPLQRFNFVYDAEACRRTAIPSCSVGGHTPDTTISVMRRLSGQLGSVLVIMAGYNDPGSGFAGAIDAVMAEAARQGIPHVMWLTLRTADVSYVGPGFVSNTFTFRDNNRILLQRALRYGGRLQIADWATYSANHPEWFYADGIHFRAAGTTPVASFIASMAARIIAGETITPELGEVPILPWVAVRRGDRGASVVTVQRALIERGYGLFGGADGVFATATERAVRQYQAANGLAVTGIVDEMTALRLAVLNAGGVVAPAWWNELRLGMGGTGVAEAQEALTRRGFRVQGGADGLFSIYMWYSVRNFQRHNRLAVTGVIDEATAQKLGLFSDGWVNQRTGMAGTRARAVQQALVRFGLNLPGGITGTYSIGTANSVRTFQRITGLPVTGVVDATTARALGVLVAPVRSTVWSNLAYRATGPRVVSAQRALMAAGFNVPGGANGVFSDYMWYYVRAFQRDHGLPVTGVIDVHTARALGIFDTSPAAWNRLAVGMTGSAVTNAEQALIAAGFDVSNGADGVFGADTYFAVLEYQHAHSLPATGMIDLYTARSLGLLDGGGISPAAAWIDLREGMGGTGVAAAQQALMRKSIFVQGGANGLYSTYMRYAVRNFQRQIGLPVTGVIDETTARALGLFSGGWTDLSTGATGVKARAVQLALVRLGLNLPGGVTGTYSTGTWYTIRTFQRLRGLPQTGVVDATTARLLGVLVAPEPNSIWTNLGRGASGSEVVAAQRALMDSGIYLNGGANGVYSDYMWYSVRNFQRRNGLRVTGSIDVLTARALGLFDTSSDRWTQLGIGSAGAAVTKAERALIAAGFGVGGGANSLFDADTYRAVQAFQRANGLPISGLIDLSTARALGLHGAPATAQVQLTAAPLAATASADTASTTSTTSSTTTTTTTTMAPTTTASSTTSLAEEAGADPSTSAVDTAAGTLGDLVWSDANGDGIQDPDEPGIAGVTVVLLDPAGGELARNVTDQFGGYALPYPADGNFLLELELPEGQAATLAHQGSDDERDSHLLTVVDEVRRLVRTDVIALPAEHPDGFDFGLVAVTAGGGEATTTSSEATTTTGMESTEPPSTTSTTVAVTTTVATTLPPTTAPATTIAPPTTAPPPTAPPTTAAPQPTTTVATSGG